MLTPAFLPETIVYLKTDADLLPRLVSSYKVTSKDITYELCCGTVVSWHYDFEIMDKLPEKENKPGFSK